MSGPQRKSDKQHQRPLVAVRNCRSELQETASNLAIFSASSVRSSSAQSNASIIILPNSVKLSYNYNNSSMSLVQWGTSGWHISVTAGAAASPPPPHLHTPLFPPVLLVLVVCCFLIKVIHFDQEREALAVWIDDLRKSRGLRRSVSAYGHYIGPGLRV